MKYRIIALALAALLLLPLAACGGSKDADFVSPGGLVVTDPADSEAPAPAPSADQGDTAAPAPAGDDASAPAPDASGDAAPDASDAGAAAPDAAAAAPAADPTPTPAPSVEPAKGVSAADVYAAVAKAAGVKYDDTTDYYDDYYNFPTSDVEDMAFYMPSMSSNMEEILVVKAKPGKADVIKSACQSRQRDMADEAETYPETGAYVSGYQLVTQGDWVLFAVCENAPKAVSAFQSAVN